MAGYSNGNTAKDDVSNTLIANDRRTDQRTNGTSSQRIKSTRTKIGFNRSKSKTSTTIKAWQSARIATHNRQVRISKIPTGQPPEKQNESEDLTIF
jgi:hypothetical protein